MSTSLEKLFLRIALVFFGWITVLVFLAVQEWFNTTSVVAVSAAAIAALVISLLWPKQRIVLAKKDWIVIAVIVAICLFIGLWHHDFSLGRDPVSYFTASIKIAETGSLSFVDELARPFHGLTELGPETYTSQFLPGYNVYLAVFYLLAGVTGLWLANIPLLFLSFAAIYIIARRLSSFGGGLGAILLTSTFYATIWFARRWTSENLFMLAIFAAIACFVVGVRKRQLSLVLLGAFPATFSLLVRGEGLLYISAYFLAAAIALIWWRKQFQLKSANWAWLALPVAVFVTFQLYVVEYGGGYVFGQGQSIFDAIWGMLEKPSVLAALAVVAILVFILFLIRYIAKYRRHSKINFWKLYWAILGIAIVVGEVVFWTWIERNLPIVKWDLYRSQFVLEIFHHYLLTIFFVIVFIGFYQKVYQRLTYLVILIALPAVVFILDPYIALDHPWFLRRFLAVFFPLIFILTAVTLSRMRLHRTSFTLCLIVLIVINLAVAGPILFHQEKAGISEQLEDFSERFSANDIILMIPGWQWQQWAYYLHFLHDTNVLPSLEGFENTTDILNVLDKYDHVYILSDRMYAHHPLFLDGQLELIDEVTWAYPEIDKPLWGLSGIFEENDGRIDVYDVHNLQQSLPPRDIENAEIELKLFQVK
ncbi:hypothetical protein ACFL0Z_01230 [Patescibacteria group bacterium]